MKFDGQIKKGEIENEKNYLNGSDICNGLYDLRMRRC